jgi:hypothetical protein
MNCGQVMWWMKRCAEVIHQSRNGLEYPVDEVAIAFPTKQSRDEFLAAAKECGLDNFDNTNDTILAMYPKRGIQSSYEVQYRFLRMPGADWRVELVHAFGSRLHATLFRNESVPTLVHASYKCGSMTEFLHEQAVLNRKGFAEEMFCASKYGLFSYRRPLIYEGAWPLGKVFLKPRLPWTNVVTVGPLP